MGQAGNQDFSPMNWFTEVAESKGEIILGEEAAMSHPGLRLLASLPHPILAFRVRGLDLQFLTLELGKEVEDDTADIWLFFILEQISKICDQGSKVWKSSSSRLVC